MQLRTRQHDFSSSFRFWVFLVLGIGAAAFAVLIRVQVAQEPLWLDELHTGWVIDGTAQQLFDRSTISNQSPAYFWLVQPITHTFGNNAFSLRAPSFVAGMSVVVLCSVIVFVQTRNITASMLTGLFAAAQEWFVLYSTEARCYAFVQLVFLIQLILVLKWVHFWHRHASPDHATNIQSPIAVIGTVVALVVSSVFLFYLHYSTILVLITEAIAVISIAGRTRFGYYGRRTYTGFVSWSFIVILSVALLSLPGIYHCYLTVQKNYDWDLVSNFPGFLLDTSTQILVLIGIPIAVYSGYRLLGTLFKDRLKNVLRHNNQNRPEQRSAILILASVGVGPVILIALSATLNLVRLDQIRYVTPSMAALLILSGLLIARLKSNRGLELVCGIVIFLFVAGMNPKITQPTTATWRDENWDLAVETIDKEFAKQAQPLFVFPNLVEDSYYAKNSTEAMQDYYRFPLNGTFKPKQHGKMSMAGKSLEGSPLFNNREVQEIQSVGSCLILLRGESGAIEIVESSLRSQFDTNKTRAIIEILPIGDSGPLFLFVVALQDRPG